MDGQAITYAELEERAASRLAKVRQEEYDVRKMVLEEMIAERLVAKEAKSRGVDPAALVKSEVTDKVAAPTDADVESVYNANRGRAGGRSKEELAPRIQKMLVDQRTAERRAAFESDLRKKASATILISAPRMAVTFPADAPTLGPADAPITLVEFTDYQCPFCHRAQETVDKVLEQYKDKVRFVHRDFPLDNHPRAIFASRASRCAGEQKKYWEYHRDLLKNPTDFSDADLKDRASRQGLNTATFEECYRSGRYDDDIKEAMDSGASLGVTGTPAFFVNGRMLYGARPLSDFQEIIDEELATTARTAGKS